MLLVTHRPAALARAVSFCPGVHSPTHTEALVPLLADEKVQRKFMELGSIPLWKSVGGTKAFVSDDARKWRKVVSDAGIAKI